MRTMTATDTALLASPHGGQSVWPKVEVATVYGSGWIDLNDLWGFDFVRGVQYAETLDTPAISATVELAAWLGTDPALSLSPLMASSPLNDPNPLCQLHSQIRISTATTPLGVRPDASDYVKVFEGRISRVSQKGSSLTVECIDEIEQLMRTLVETAQTYGNNDAAAASATGNLLEDHIQNILDDNVNSTASAPRANSLPARTTDGAPWQVYSPNGDATTPYTGGDIRNAKRGLTSIPKTTVWQAIFNLSQTIQWTLRRRWHEGTGINDFVLVFEEPDRSGTTAAFSLDPLAGQCNIETVDRDVSDIRNVIRVGYQTGAGRRDIVTQNDATSITAYATRTMEVDLGSASNVDTSTEATKFARAARDDLADPQMIMALSMPYRYWVQLNDLVEVKRDNMHLDTDVKLGVFSRTNTIQPGQPGRTDLVFYGAPRLGVEIVKKQQRVMTVPPGKSLSREGGFIWGNSLHPNGNFADDKNQ